MSGEEGRGWWKSLENRISEYIRFTGHFISEYKLKWRNTTKQVK